MQAQANEDTNNTNRKNVKETNELNYRMFREARGEGGNAILPLYMPKGTEERMAGGAIQVYDAVTGKPVNLTMDEYNRMVAEMQPAVQGGNNLINSIYTGELGSQRLAELDPVLAARQRLAEADATAIDLALAQEQNRIAAEEAARGYTGGGSFVNNRMLAATLGARQQAARTKGAATLQNATDVRGVKEGTRQLQLQSLDMPMERVNRLIQLSQAPAAGLVARQNLAQRALDWFKLNPGSPPSAQSFQAPQSASMGALIASGVAQAGGSAMNYWQQQQLINAIGQNAGAGAGASLGSGAASGAAADYAGELLI